MRTNFRYAILAVILTGCVSTQQLRMDSARAIQPTPHPDSVQISEIHINKVTQAGHWVARTPHGVYDCIQEIQDAQHPKLPVCAKRDTP